MGFWPLERTFAGSRQGLRIPPDRVPPESPFPAALPPQACLKDLVGEVSLLRSDST